MPKLYVKCKTCNIEFASGIGSDEKSFPTSVLSGNQHECPKGHTSIYDKKDYYLKRFEKCVHPDLPDDKVSEFILDSEKSHPKLKYEARPAKSGKLDHKDMWTYLKPGEEP